MAAPVVLENIPIFRAKSTDRVVSGRNNTFIILGTDRSKNGPAGFGDGLGHTKAPGGGKGAGAIHVIAGMNGGDPDLSADKSTIYLSMKTDIDKNLGTDGVQTNKSGVPGIIAKSDTVRIVARDDVKIVVQTPQGNRTYIFANDSKVTINSQSMHLTGGCQNPWSKMFDKIIEWIQKHDHMTAVGPTSIATGGVQTATLQPEFISEKRAWLAGIGNS